MKTLRILNGPAEGVTVDVPEDSTFNEECEAVLEAILDVVTRESPVGRFPVLVG
jgi:hypothetical protein